MCVSLASDRNSDFYRGANFFENVKNYEKVTFSAKTLKCVIRIGQIDVFLNLAVNSDRSMSDPGKNRSLFCCLKYIISMLTNYLLNIDKHMKIKPVSVNEIFLLFLAKLLLAHHLHHKQDILRRTLFGFDLLNLQWEIISILLFNI